MQTLPRHSRRACQCAACDLVFGGLTVFDAHRVGSPGVSLGPNRRRCLTEAELLAKGQRPGPRGWGRPYGGPNRLRAARRTAAAA